MNHAIARCIGEASMEETTEQVTNLQPKLLKNRKSGIECPGNSVKQFADVMVTVFTQLDVKQGTRAFGSDTATGRQVGGKASECKPASYPARRSEQRCST